MFPLSNFMTGYILKNSFNFSPHHNLWLIYIDQTAINMSSPISLTSLALSWSHNFHCTCVEVLKDLSFINSSTARYLNHSNHENNKSI